MRKVPTTSPPEPKRLDVLGGGRTNDTDSQSPDGHSQGIERSETRLEEVKNPACTETQPVGTPDIEYQGVKIDLDWYEWIVVGVFAVILAILLR